MMPAHRIALRPEDLKQEQRVELQRVVASAESDEFGTLRESKTDIARFLNYLGNKTIQQTEARAKEKDLLQELFKIAQIKTPRNQDEIKKKTDNSNKIITIRSRAKTFLKQYYAAHPPQKIRVEVPPTDQRNHPQGAYRIVFTIEEHPAAPAVSLWRRMIEPVYPVRGLLIYPNENKELGSNDKYSGKGEVAAGLLIGLKAAYLSCEPEPRPCIDVKAAEIALAHSWFVFLGSHPSDTLLDQITKENPWQKLQPLYFTRPEEVQLPGNVPVICCDGPRNEEGEIMPKLLWSHKRVKGRAPITEEYAMVSYLRDDELSRVIIICAGMSTTGTQAAAEFLCRDRKVETLQKTLKIDPDDKRIPCFQVVLRLDVPESGNYSVSIEKAYRALKPGEAPIEIEPPLS